MIHGLSQEILNFSMYMLVSLLGCKVALEQDLSIGDILDVKNTWMYL